MSGGISFFFITHFYWVYRYFTATIVQKKTTIIIFFLR